MNFLHLTAMPQLDIEESSSQALWQDVEFALGK